MREPPFFVFLYSKNPNYRTKTTSMQCHSSLRPQNEMTLRRGRYVRYS